MVVALVGEGCYEVNSREQQQEQQQTSSAADKNEREIWSHFPTPPKSHRPPAPGPPPGPKQLIHKPPEPSPRKNQPGVIHPYHTEKRPPPPPPKQQTHNPPNRRPVRTNPGDVTVYGASGPDERAKANARSCSAVPVSTLQPFLPPFFIYNSTSYHKKLRMPATLYIRTQVKKMGVHK